MSLEDGSAPEKSEVPQPVKEVIEKYLTYQTVERRHRGLRIHNALKNADTVKYASALLTAGEREPGGMKHVSDTADNLRAAMQENAAKLKLPLSQWAKDSSWAMRDLGKQYYYYLHQDEAGDIEKEKRVDPFEETAQGNLVLWDVANRGLAVEARKAFYDKRTEAAQWKAEIESDSAYTEAIGILADKKERNHGHLTFVELTKLGAILHDIAERKNIPDTQVGDSAEQTETQQNDLEAQPKTEEKITHLKNAPSIVPEEMKGVITEEDLVDLMRASDEEKARENANRRALEAADPRTIVHHMDTIAGEMRDALRGLGESKKEENGQNENPSNEQTEATQHPEKHEDHAAQGKDAHKREKGKHDDHDEHHEEPLETFRPTWKGIGKAALHSLWVIPGSLGLVSIYEFSRTAFQSLKNMFSVAWAWLKYPSHAALNSNEGLGTVEDVNNEGKKTKGGDDHDDHGGNKKKKAAGGHEKAKKKDDHDAKGDHGHDAHGGGHGKKKDDHGHGGDGHK
jgi:hypothetical protein